VRRSGPSGAREAGKIVESPIAVGWRSAGSPAEKRADYAARIVLCAFAAILWLMFAAEARAQDGPGSSGEGAPAVDPVGGGASAEEESPAPDPTTGPGAEVPTPPADDPAEQPPPSPPPADEAPPASPPPAPPAESPPAPPATPEPPPAQPPASPPAQNPPLGAGETPFPGPPLTPPGSVPVPLLSPDELVTPAPSGELTDVQPVSNGESASTVQAPAASRGGSVVEIRPDGLPSLLSSDARGRLAAVALTTDRLDVNRGSQSNTENEAAAGARSAGDAPLLPSWPLGDQAPSTPYASTGGVGGGSSGGFFAWVVAGLIGLLAASAQRLGSLVPLTLSPPRCTAYVFGLERPD
jgi:hypothetical protein